jgi:ATP-dependent DNA ligase
MKTDTVLSAPVIKKVKQWKKDQAIVSLTLDELLKITKGKKLIAEQKVDGQTGLLEFSKGTTQFGTLGGVIYSDLPVLDEIKKILENTGLHQALIVGEMAGYENGKIISFNQTESIIKNPRADKTKVHWFPYQILELDDEKFSTTSFEVYMKTWPQLKKIFRGSKYVHPVEDTEDIKEAWDKMVLKNKNEGIVVRTEDNKVYKCKPEFSYDLVILAVGSKKGKNWPKKQIGMTLMAFMDKDRVFRTAGHIGTGWTREQSQDLFKWAQANKVGEDDTYVWVRPQKVVECVWERTSLKEMPSYRFVKGKYEEVEKRMSGTIVKPRFIRYRTDKAVTPADLRLTQIPNWSEKQKMAHRVACNFIALELSTTSPHRAIYIFKNPEEYKKACGLLDQGIGYKRPEYNHGKIDSQLQISIPEDKHERIESLWAKNGIKDFERSSSEIAG